MSKPNLDTPVNNTPYGNEELEHFKKLLNTERKKTEKEIGQLKESIEDIQNSNDDINSSFLHHQGNIASDEEEEDTKYQLIERNKNKMDEINAALDRIDQHTYGICENTGKKIQAERLEAKPYARYSVEAKRKDEQV